MRSRVAIILVCQHEEQSCNNIGFPAWGTELQYYLFASMRSRVAIIFVCQHEEQSCNTICLLAWGAELQYYLCRNLQLFARRRYFVVTGPNYQISQVRCLETKSVAINWMHRMYLDHSVYFSKAAIQGWRWMAYRVSAMVRIQSVISIHLF